MLGLSITSSALADSDHLTVGMTNSLRMGPSGDVHFNALG